MNTEKKQEQEGEEKQEREEKQEQSGERRKEEEQEQEQEQGGGSGEKPVQFTEVKNAHASGMGAIGGHDETLPPGGSVGSGDDY